MTPQLRELLDHLGLRLGATLKQHYRIQCRDQHGVRLWLAEFDNLVTTEGLNKYLDACLKTGLAAPAWYVSLITATTTGPALGDTLAVHAGWTEGTPGVHWTGNRIAWTPGAIAAGSVDNSAAPAVFPILASITVYGALLASVATGTVGTLLGAGTFGTPQPAIATNVLDVTITNSLS